MSIKREVGTEQEETAVESALCFYCVFVYFETASSMRFYDDITKF